MASERDCCSGDAASTPPRRQRTDLEILQSLRRILRAVDIHSRRLSTTYRVTSPQLVCLLSLIEKGPLTITALARNVSLSPSTVIGIVDRLEEKGLALRKRSTEDRRRVLVSVTQAGADLARNAPSPLRDNLVARLDALPEDELDGIASALEKLVGFMEARQLDAAPILQVGPVSEEKGRRTAPGFRRPRQRSGTPAGGMR